MKISNERVNFIERLIAWIFALLVLGLIIITTREVRVPLPIEPVRHIANSTVEPENLPELTKPVKDIPLSPANNPNQSPSVKKPIKKPNRTKSVDDLQILLEERPSAGQDDVISATEISLNEESSPEVLVPPTHIAFNIWSLSELRLRRAYTELMNDGSTTSDDRKKDYLVFVNNKTKKCGHLNANFEKNINSIEKIKFKDNDSKILGCLSTENISEYNKLYAFGYQE